MPLSRSSAFVRSCWVLLAFRSDGRGHGSHDFMDPRVPDLMRDAGRLRIDAPRWCEESLRNTAVCERLCDACPLCSAPSGIVDDMSSESCFEATGEARVIAGCEDDDEAWTAHAGP
jgi:hypothetical protein